MIVNLTFDLLLSFISQYCFLLYVSYHIVSILIHVFLENVTMSQTDQWEPKYMIHFLEIFFAFYCHSIQENSIIYPGLGTNKYKR